MNGHQQRHNPHSPLNMLWTHSRDGQPAPDGWAFNAVGQLVQLAYQPWQSQPHDQYGTTQPPWESLDNPVYQSFANNRSTIEIQPSTDPSVGIRYGKDPLGRAVPPMTAENVALVPASEYMRDEDTDVPTQDNGTLALTPSGSRGSVARTAYRLSKPLISYTMVPSPDEPFSLAIVDPTQPQPLNVPPVQANIGVPPIGGCVSLAQISFGHLGGQFQSYYDVPPAQIIHVPFGGSFGQTDSMLAPKYYTPFFDPTDNLFRHYFLFPGGPTLTNANWNTLTQDILPRNNFTNPNKVPFMGWFAQADSFSNTTFSQPIRRFYGSVLCTPVLPNPQAIPPTGVSSVTVCPVAWFASVVTLISNPGLNFIVRGQTTAAGVQYYGPFPANTAITLPANATSILVFPVVVLQQPGMPNGNEVLFELDYTLSF